MLMRKLRFNRGWGRILHWARIVREQVIRASVVIPIVVGFLKRLCFEQGWGRILHWARIVRASIVIPIVVGFLLAIVVFVRPELQECKMAHWLCYLSGSETKKEVLRQLGWIAAGMLSVWGIFVASRRAKAMADTVKATEEGNRQQRFKDAVEQLGHKTESVRMGGAHTLIHVALEVESWRQSIVEILCAHIQCTTREKEYKKRYAKTPSTEIQLLMRLLFVESILNEKKFEKLWMELKANLSGSYLRGIDLQDAQFQRARLQNAQFQGALLQNAQFQGARLTNTQFQRARLQNAQFQGALLQNAQFQGVQLQNAQFQGALLTNAQFQKAQLRNAQFQRARLQNAKFQRALLRNAQFQRARLRNAQFQRAQLRDAQFQGALLTNAQFQGAQLQNAQFQGAWLQNAKFQGCVSDSPTQWNDSFSKQIMQCVGKDAELSGAIFAGGIQQDDLYRIVEELGHIEEMSHEELDAFRNALAEHVDNPERRGADGIPEQFRGNVDLGAYTEEEAKEWIASYEESMKTAASPDEA